MAKTVAVRPGSVLRTDFVFRKNKWQYGSRADFQIEFLDDAGKSVKRHTIDASIMGGGYISMSFAELSSLTALHEKISYFNYFRVPANGTQVRLIAGFAGNPCELELLDWKLREVDPALSPWFRQPPMGVQLSYPYSPAMTDEAVRNRLVSRPRTESRLVREHDRLAWHINGKKIAPVILHNPITGSYERVTAFRKAGFPLFTSAVILGRAPYPDDYNQIWLEDGSIDVSGMEKAVYRVLRENPDAHVILNLIVYPSANWLKNNRKELHPGKDGNPLILRNGAFTNRTSAEFPVKPGETWSPSIHSAKYRADIARVLEEVMRKFEKTDASKAVAAIYVTGGDDGQFRAPVIPDDSPVAQMAFRQFLKEKYKTPAALSQAWQKKVAAWENVTIPTDAQMKGKNDIVFTPGLPCVESDYRKFISSECTKLKMAMRKAVKTGAPRLLVGGYDCAVALSGSIWYGRGAYAHSDIIRDPYCDFLISLPGYERSRDECLIPMGLKAFTGSMRLHKKLIISEMDIRNPEQPTLGWIYRSRNWQAVHNYRTFSELLKLYAGYAAAWGGAFHAYSMGRNYYNTPEALAAWKSAAAIASAAPGEPLSDDRVALILDERSSDFFYHSPLGHFNSESWNRNPGHVLWLSQVRFDAYLADDLFHKDFKAPKILLLANLATLTPEKLADIRKRYLKNGRTLVYLGLPGIFSGSKITELSKALNVTFVQPETIRNRSIFVENATDPLLHNISGYLYAPTESRPVVHYGNAGILPQNDLQVLAPYQNTDVGGMAVRRSADGTEIFIGQPAAVSPQLIRNIAKSAGIQPVSDGDDLTVRGGGLIVMGGSSRSGIRRIYYPAGVKKLECLTGQKVLLDNGKYLEFDLKYGECAVFRCVR